MEKTKRATIYFEPEVHRALHLRAAACNRSVSEMVNEAVRVTLGEVADDLRDADLRKNEPSTDFEGYLASLRDCGRL